MYLRGRYPYKHNSEINEILQQKSNGYVLEDEACDIIRYMYNEEDSDYLISELKNLCTK